MPGISSRPGIFRRPSAFRRLALGGPILLGLALSACNPFLSAERKHAIEQNVLLPRTQPPLDPQYCYRTLAEVDCYAYPLSDQAYRRVGPIPLPALQEVVEGY